MSRDITSNSYFYYFCYCLSSFYWVQGIVLASTLSPNSQRKILIHWAIVPVGYVNWHIPDEGRKEQRSKRCDNDNKDENNIQHINNVNNDKPSSQKLCLIYWLISFFTDYQLPVDYLKFNMFLLERIFFEWILLSQYFSKSKSYYLTNSWGEMDSLEYLRRSKCKELN